MCIHVDRTSRNGDGGVDDGDDDSNDANNDSTMHVPPGSPFEKGYDDDSNDANNDTTMTATMLTTTQQ